MIEYGYCRISTAKQSIERQIRNIRAEHPQAVIVQEVFTGTKTDGRKKFEALLKTVKPGDLIVFDSVSRMSRNAEEGFTVYQDLFSKGIELEFIKEPQINTTAFRNALKPLYRSQEQILTISLRELTSFFWNSPESK